MPLPQRLYACICAIAKDEAIEDVREWVWYHLGLGFEHIILYDNYSESGELKKALKEEVAASLVTVIPFPVRVAPQLSAYAQCLRIMRHRCRWLAFIDLDEFIVPPSAADNIITDGYDHVRAMLANYHDFAGLAISWQVFGSSGHIRRPASGVLANYTESLPHHIVKSIVWPEKVTRPVSPHHFALSESSVCVNEDGVPVAGSVSYHVARAWRINHYYYKSQQDFEAKIARGLATNVKGIEGPGRSLDIFYDHLQKNWQDDRRILDFTGYGQKLQDLGAEKAASILHSDARSCLDESMTRINELSKKLEVDAAINLLKRIMWYHDFVTPIPESNSFEPSDTTPWQLAQRPEMQLLRSRMNAGSPAHQVGLLLAGLYRSWGLDEEAKKARDFFCDQPGG